MSNHPLKTHFTSPLIRYFGKRKERQHFSKPPIFIGGCARSGTSLLLSILSAHPALFCFPNETDAFTEWEESSSGLKPVREDRMYRSLLVSRVPKTAFRWCEKRPSNVRYIPQILRYFGASARFIHIVRDPRAVCTSRHPTRPHDYWVEPERWIQDVKVGLAFQEHPQVLTIRYEDLVLDTETQIRFICDFIGEECPSEILDWPEYAQVRTHAAWFVDIGKIQKSTLEKWKSPEHKDRVTQILEYREIKAFLNL